MAFTNLPPNLQDMFYNLQDQINKLLLAPNAAMTAAESAQGSSTQALAEAAAADAAAQQAMADAAQALSEATVAYNKAVGSLQPSASTIVNASNQMTAISTNGITVYSGSSASSGARVVMNSLGLAGYNSSGTATFSVEASTGNATFSGNVTGSTITGGTLNIGGNAIINSSGYLTATGATITGTITSSNATITGGSLTVGSYFQVTSTGLLTASNANVTGTLTTSALTATGGTIGGWNISSTKLYTGTPGSENQYLNAAGGGLLTGSYTIGTLGVNGDTTLGSNLLLGGTVTSANFNLSTSTEFRVPYAYTNTVTNAATVWISSTGQLRRSTASSQRYKTDIVNLTEVSELDPTALYDLPVRAFRYKDEFISETDDRYETLIPGFIAEEIDALYPQAADYENGQVETWNTRTLIPPMLSLIQDLNNRVKLLEGN